MTIMSRSNQLTLFLCCASIYFVFKIIKNSYLDHNYYLWHLAPFTICFVVFYAALQTVPQEPVEAAIIDGASRFQRVRHIVLPHIYPVVTFVALISLMDNFRVFEPIIGFSAEGSAQSLSWLIYDNLVNEEVILFGSAAATSMMTIIGIAILLAPVLIRTWREFRTVR